MKLTEPTMLALNRGGVRRLCVGHTPHGISPTIIKSGGPGTCAPCVEVVMADTSFSDMSKPDNRGAAVYEVQVLEGKRLRIHGNLPTSDKISFGGKLDFTLEEGVGPGHELVGMEQPVGMMESQDNGQALYSTESERYFIKAQLDMDHYLACHVNGFVYKYNKLSAQQATELVMPLGLQPLRPQREVSILTSCSGDHNTQGSQSEFCEARKALISVLFKDLDTDGNMKISRKELHAVLSRGGSQTLELLHLDYRSMELATDSVMEEIDTNGDGFITQEELENFFHKEPQSASPCETVPTPTTKLSAIPVDLFLSRGFLVGVAASILVHRLFAWVGFDIFGAAARRIQLR